MSNDRAMPDAARDHQMFPVLGALDVARLGPFGHTFRFQPKDLLVTAGKPVPGVFLILTGAVDVTHRDGLGHIVPLRRYGRGEFLGEIGALTGAAALVDGQAIGEVEALLVVPDQLRALIIAEADLGERLMRAMILRRVRLIESDASGPALIGNATAPNLMRLQNFLQRAMHSRITLLERAKTTSVPNFLSSMGPLCQML